MSDQYEHAGVTITPQPGGYYELSHPSLEEPIRERGKEKAEQRAEDFAASLKHLDEGHIAPQGDLPDVAALVPPVVTDVTASAPSAAPDVGATPAPTDPIVQMLLEQNQQMQKQMSAMSAHMAEMAAAGVRTVAQTEGDMAPRIDAPRTYAGEMDKGQRKRLEAKGHKIHKIILEENESIPPTGLFVSHNGRPYMIQPGIPVDVPDFLLDLLNDAVMSAPIVNTESKKVVGYRDRLKYSYRQVE